MSLVDISSVRVHNPTGPFFPAPLCFCSCVWDLVCFSLDLSSPSVLLVVVVVVVAVVLVVVGFALLLALPLETRLLGTHGISEDTVCLPTRCSRPLLLSFSAPTGLDTQDASVSRRHCSLQHRPDQLDHDHQTLSGRPLLFLVCFLSVLGKPISPSAWRKDQESSSLS